MSTKQLALNDVYGRQKAFLEGGTAIGSTLHLTHQALAQRLGCSREMVSKLMKDLEIGKPPAAGGQWPLPPAH